MFKATLCITGVKLNSWKKQRNLEPSVNIQSLKCAQKCNKMRECHVIACESDSGLPPADESYQCRD